jgi:hypothetical protein
MPPRRTLPAASPYPVSTRSELLAIERQTHKKTIIDHVQEIHELLIEDQEYQKYLKAIFNSQAVEGSVRDDRAVAAQMIRAKAREVGKVELLSENLASIRTALTYAEGRYEGLSLSERREAFEQSHHREAFEQTQANESQGNLSNEEGQEG